MDIGKKILAVSILSVLLFTALNIFTYLKINSMQQQYDKLLMKTVPILQDVQSANTEIWVQNAEARAYILSGNEAYKQKYEDSKKRTVELFNKLGVALNGDDAQKLYTYQSDVAQFEKDLEIGMGIRSMGDLQQTLQFLESSDSEINVAQGEGEKFLQYMTKQTTGKINAVVESVNMLKNMALFLNVVILLLAAGGAFGLARLISRPLKAVAGAAQEIAAGNLQVEKITYFPNDEVGDMAQAVNHMVDNLSRIIRQVAGISEQVAASSQQLSATTEQSSQASIQVVQAVSEVSAGTERQTQVIGETTAVVREMVDSMEQIANNAGEVSAQSGSASQMAKAGEAAVNEAIRQMQAISNSVSQSAGVVDNLGSSSRQISEIVGVISGIAGQTNLLALNAAIEAARAGEHGRGFAVVAEEVRNLADQSNAAAQKISEIIGVVQRETNLVVNTMNTSTLEAAQGIEVISQTGVRFREIVGIIGELDRQIRQISYAAEHLAQSGERVAASVNEVSLVAGNNAFNTQTISAATEEQAASLEEIHSSSQALATMAENLQEMVHNFKL
jgi:methyl-accepting chemotaxis protein